MRSPARLMSPALLLISALAVAACGGAPPPAPLSPADSAGPLVLRPGDVVKVQVFGHDELSGEYPVDENDSLLLPIIGEISVQGMPVPDLRRRIRSEFSRLFTQSYVSVTPLFRVAVIGEVMRPGLYSVDPTMTIYDVLATAGGPSPESKRSQIKLIRAGRQVPVPLEPDYLARATLRELGVRSGDQVTVPRRRLSSQDWWVLLTALNTALLAYTIFR
jgi:polysaccharide biosynthesis/export protein